VSGEVQTGSSRPGSLVGAIASRLTDPDSGLGLSERQIGLAASIWSAPGCCSTPGRCRPPPWVIGVEAAGRSLEDVARPLTAEEEEAEAPA
jgi:hypothetical protein